MTGAIVGLVALYSFVIFAGKHVKRPGIGGILLLGMIAALQVAAALYFVFTIKTPATS